MSAYKQRKINGKSYSEHRLIAEQMLGRKLRPNELVHHINHDKHDNRPENLAVTFAQPHSAHHNQKYPTFRYCDNCGCMYRPKPARRGRSKTCSRECFSALAARNQTGAANSASKLTDADYDDIIRRLRAGHVQAAIAADHGVSPPTITRIKQKYL